MKVLTLYLNPGKAATLDGGNLPRPVIGFATKLNNNRRNDKFENEVKMKPDEIRTYASKDKSFPEAWNFFT